MTTEIAAGNISDRFDGGQPISECCVARWDNLNREREKSEIADAAEPH